METFLPALLGWDQVEWLGSLLQNNVKCYLVGEKILWEALLVQCKSLLISIIGISFLSLPDKFNLYFCPSFLRFRWNFFSRFLFCAKLNCNLISLDGYEASKYNFKMKELKSHERISAETENEERSLSWNDKYEEFRLPEEYWLISG